MELSDNTNTQHAAPRTAVARAEPDSGADNQRRHHPAGRCRRLVDQALRFSGLALSVSDHVRGRLLAARAAGAGGSGRRATGGSLCKLRNG